MPVNKRHINAVMEEAEDEGNPVLHVAPGEAPATDIPPQWARVLASPDAVTEVLKMWDPIARRVPKTLKAMKRSLQGVGVLTTDARPPSIIYFFTMDDKAPSFYRGYAPVDKLPKVSSQLPKEFLEFYRLHDGWVDDSKVMGPMRSGDWHPLGEAKTPAGKFLVVFNSGGGGVLGFDLRESPALCYLLEDDESPEVVPKIWSTLDEWISEQMEDFVPVKK